MAVIPETAAGVEPAVGRGARIALVVALVLSVALIVWAFTFPAYEGLETSGGITRAATRTMVEENGPRVLLPIAVPLAVSSLVAVLVLRGREPWARVGAWVLTGLLGVFAVLALFSIGMYVAPIVLALAVATAWPRRDVAA